MFTFKLDYIIDIYIIEIYKHKIYRLYLILNLYNIFYIKKIIKYKIYF